MNQAHMTADIHLLASIGFRTVLTTCHYGTLEYLQSYWFQTPQ